MPSKCKCVITRSVKMQFCGKKPQNFGLVISKNINVI